MTDQSGSNRTSFYKNTKSIIILAVFLVSIIVIIYLAVLIKNSLQNQGSIPTSQKIFISKTILNITRHDNKQFMFNNGDFLLVTWEDARRMELETLSGEEVGVLEKETIFKAGKIVTVPWDEQWDDIRIRKGPLILLFVSIIIGLFLFLITIHNDPYHKEKEAMKGILWLYFVLAMLVMGGFFVDVKISHSIERSLYLYRYDVMLGLVGLSVGIPYVFVVVSFFEGVVTLFIRLKYLFTKRSVREVIMERRNKQESEKKRKEYEAKKNDIDEKEAAVQRRLSVLHNDIPEVISELPRDIADYQGYFRGIEKRFQERQMTKTTKVIRERVEEARMLCEEGVKLQRARTELEVAKYEFATVDQDIEIRKKERTLKDKELDRDILQADAEIMTLKKMFLRKKKREDHGL